MVSYLVIGSTENAGPVNKGPMADQTDQRPTGHDCHIRDQISRVEKMQDRKMHDQKYRVGIAGQENVKPISHRDLN